jgi:hypothetical protein
VLSGDDSSGYVGAIDVALNGLVTGPCGDADGSGSVTVTDGVQALRKSAGLSSECASTNCAVDGSGAVTVTDGVNVLRAAAGVAVDLNCP